MILTLQGTDLRYYAQTLCMIFFPGSTFGENEQTGVDIPEIAITMEREGEKGYFCRTVIRMNGEEAQGEGHAQPDENITRPDRLEKLAIGRAVFAAGKSFFGYIPPWGILTGVRPTKVATELLAQGGGVQKARRVLRDEYFLNPKKAALAVSVASTEAKLTKRLPDNLCSVYVSIPFCPSRCAYCSFVSASIGRLMGVLADYLQVLEREIDTTFRTIAALGMTVATVYIGGGTPTVLDERQLESLLAAVTRNVDPKTLMEFTLEAGRPDTINREKLAIAARYGVTRVSVNPQTLNEEVLRNVGRRHTVEDFFRAYDLAKESGIRDINVDLIAGLPGDRFASFASTMDRVIALAPSNITVHTMCVKNAADLKESGHIYSLTGGDAAKSVEYSQLQTNLAGYKPYYMYRQKNTVGNLENVGYSVEGSEGYYNIFMMEELHSIFAVGAGAVTKLVKYRPPKEGSSRIQRIFVPKYPYEYLRDIDKIRNGSPEEGKPALQDRILEFFGK